MSDARFTSHNRRREKMSMTVIDFRRLEQTVIWLDVITRGLNAGGVGFEA